MVASDMDEGAGEGWGEDAALEIDEGTYFFLKSDFLFVVLFFINFHLINLITEGGFGDDGLDGDILGGDEEGGGWDVGDEDLVLPPDLVNFC